MSAIHNMTHVENIRARAADTSSLEGYPSREEVVDLCDTVFKLNDECLFLCDVIDELKEKLRKKEKEEEK